MGFNCPGKRRIRDESENRERFMADSHAVFGSEPDMAAEIAWVRTGRRCSRRGAEAAETPPHPSAHSAPLRGA